MGRLKTVVSIAVVLLGVLVPFSWSCSPPVGWRPSTLVEEIHGGERVLYGRVKSQYPDHTFPEDANVFTVELEVFCVLKGEKTPLIVNITGAGYIPGYCTSTKFSVEQLYVAIADSKLGAVKDIPATGSNLSKVRRACGLNPVTRPAGSKSNVVCPVSSPDCESKPPDNRGEEEREEHEEPDLSYELYDSEVAPKMKNRNNGATTYNAGLSVAMMMMMATVAGLTAVASVAP